jgi:hypothetical protein
MDSGEEVDGETVAADGDTSEVLETVEYAFDGVGRLRTDQMELVLGVADAEMSFEEVAYL